MSGIRLTEDMSSNNGDYDNRLCLNKREQDGSTRTTSDSGNESSSSEPDDISSSSFFRIDRHMVPSKVAYALSGAYTGKSKTKHISWFHFFGPKLMEGEGGLFINFSKIFPFPWYLF